MREFRVVVASLPDREEVVAELWLGERHVAELSRTTGGLRLQIYQPPGSHWDFDYEELAQALAKMREKVLRAE